MFIHSMKQNILKTICLLLVLIIYEQAIAQPQVRNTYRFYNTLSTTEADCAPNLLAVNGLNLLCQAVTAPSTGMFISDALSPSTITRTVYHNNLNWGLRYTNTDSVIGNTYTIQIYLRVTNFNNAYTRIIDFSDGVQDNGIYFTNFNTPGPSSDRCLNFYPNGNFGICPYFNDHTYYLLTFTRNNVTKKIDIYVNDQLFTSYYDGANFYVGTAGKPVHIFRDDPVGFACEDGEANFAYLSFANFYSTQFDVSSVYQNLNTLVSTADFSLSASDVCPGKSITVNYTGNIPATALQYFYNWNWDGGNVISGSGRGPYVVKWNNTGTKTIILNITGTSCGAAISNSKQLTVTASGNVTQIDTTICAGTSAYGHSSTGTYSDTIHHPQECDSIRNINLKVISTTAPDIPATLVLCTGDSIILSPGDYDSYLWQDGSTQKTYTVKRPGMYSVTVSNKCIVTTSQAQVTESNCSIYFPNAFTPNKDGRNEQFKILTNRLFAQFNLAIYNRYGQKVFESASTEPGWDGSFKGSNAEAGSYVWICSFRTDAAAALQTMRGSILLLR
ncbi:MAG: gliding motility-associated C-terminal domain-containing protein [Ferruginibacter sp.]